MPFIDIAQQNAQQSLQNGAGNSVPGDDIAQAQAASPNDLPMPGVAASPVPATAVSENANPIDQNDQSDQSDATKQSASSLPPLPGDAATSQVSQVSPVSPVSPVSELNSLNIPAAATEASQMPQPPKDSLTVDVDDQGVKTISSAALQTAEPAPQAATTVPTPPKAASVSNSPVSPSPETPVSATNLSSPAVPAETAPAQPSASLESTPAATTTTDATAAQATPATPAETPASSGGAQAEANDPSLLSADTTIDELMILAHEKGASDIHFTANYPVMFRVDGKLLNITNKLTPEQSSKLAASMFNDEQKKIYDENKELDFSYTSSKGVRFRVNVFTDKGNSAGALRLINTKIRTMEELNLPEVMHQIVEEPHGLVLVVGPTGSGKSTTLAAMINNVNMKKAEHIITIEDPIEYIYPVGKSIVNQRELAADTLSWKHALKSALREDPNVVLVGEMRDLDTIEATITIAETGHLTFATLHTNSAAQAIDRIIDVFPEGAKDQIRAQLANVLVAVISQRLVPSLKGGRKAALEVMLGTVAVKNAIREGKTYQIDNIIQTSGDLGMVTIEKALVDLVKNGEITSEQAKAYSAKPDEIESLLSK